jgi:molecular chaperone DnaJ
VAAQADWLEKDLYSVLGVAEDSDSAQIKRAYRKLARDLHPDTHPDDPAAAERFKEVTAAYGVIGDEAKRAEYDEFRQAVAGARAWGGERGQASRGEGPAWTRFDGRDFAGGDEQAWTVFDGSAWSTLDPDGFEDLFGSVLGDARRAPSRMRRGSDLEAVLHLGFEDAVRGLTTEVTVDGPEASRTFKVRVPAGVEEGQRLRVAGKGSPGINGGPPGDLYAVIRIGSHPVFERRGQDLIVEVPISWPEAVLGTEIQVPTLDGPPVRVRVPAGTPEGRTLRVRGRGVQTAKVEGDLLVRVRLTVPDHLTEEQKAAVEVVAEAFRAA